MLTPEDKIHFLFALRSMLNAGEVTFGQATRALRAGFLGIERARFARIVGLSVRMLAKIETDAANPTLQTLTGIFEPFGLRVGVASLREDPEEVGPEAFGAAELAEWKANIKGAIEGNTRRRRASFFAHWRAEMSRPRYLIETHAPNVFALGFSDETWAKADDKLAERIAVAEAAPRAPEQTSLTTQRDLVGLAAAADFDVLRERETRTGVLCRDFLRFIDAAVGELTVQVGPGGVAEVRALVQRMLMQTSSRVSRYIEVVGELLAARWALRQAETVAGTIERLHVRVKSKHLRDGDRFDRLLDAAIAKKRGASPVELHPIIWCDDGAAFQSATALERVWRHLQSRAPDPQVRWLALCEVKTDGVVGWDFDELAQLAARYGWSPA